MSRRRRRILFLGGGASGSAPVNTTPPVIAGTTPYYVGSTLTGTDGNYTGNPAPTLTRTYQIDVGSGWVDVATASSYVITNEDQGSTTQPKARIKEVATNASGSITTYSNEIDLFNWNTSLATSNAMWLDAATDSTISEISGSVSGWGDRAGHTSGIAQLTGTAQPRINTATLNSLPVVDFQGNDNMAGALNVSQTVTYVFVGKTNNASALQYFFDGSTARQLFNIENVSGWKWQIFAGGGDFQRAAGVNTNAHIFLVKFGGGTGQLYIDGVLVASGSIGSNAINGLVLGSRFNGVEFLSGRFGELGIFAGNLSTTDKNLSCQYLAAKWGLSCATIT